MREACIASVAVMCASLFALMVAPARAAEAPAEPAARARLERLVRHDCGSCHGMTLKGGLGPALTPERMSAFDAGTLARVILDGVPGSAMPPWRALLSDQDAAWIAAYLRTGERP